MFTLSSNPVMDMVIVCPLVRFIVVTAWRTIGAVFSAFPRAFLVSIRWATKRWLIICFSFFISFGAYRALFATDPLISVSVSILIIYALSKLSSTISSIRTITYLNTSTN